MRFRNNARTGVLIGISIIIVILIILLIINIIPDVDYNTLNMTDKMMYDMGVYEGKTPTWKNICMIILCVLSVLEIIVNVVMCRCNYCGRYIISMNIFMKYCPYCSKSLDATEEDILKEETEKSDIDI